MGRKSSAKKSRRSQPRRGGRRAWLRPGTALSVAAVLGVGGLLWLGSREGGTGLLSKGEPAPGFTLPSTLGGTASLEDFSGRNVLLYFNEGAGCGSCFTQIVELEPHLGHLGELNTMLLPVSPNPMSTTIAEAGRYGIGSPFLIDETLEVATAYDTLGRGHHAELPGHSFILVDEEGAFRWRGDYPGMWVSPGDLLASIDAALNA